MQKTIFNFIWALVMSSISACNAQVGDGNSNVTSVTDDSNVKQLSIVQKLKDRSDLSVKEKVTLYYALKKDSAMVYNFNNEDELNMYGYALLWDNKTEEAIIIFKLLVAEFPNSPNAYDSLAEAYLKNGNTELAQKNYEISLSMDPNNFNAEDQIDKIKYPNKVPLTPIEQFEKIYPANQYKQDLNQLGNTLLEVHPNALKFISKAAFWESIEAKQALITDNTTYGEFVWFCSEIIANVHCSHTNMGSFYYEDMLLPVTKRFPLQTRWVNNKLFVVDPLDNEYHVKVKDEIISINGVSVTKIMDDIYKHIASQGYIETTKERIFNMWCAVLIPYALHFPEQFSIILAKSNNPILLRQSATTPSPFFDQSIDFAGKNLDLKITKSTSTAFLTIASFNYYRWNDFDVFKNFIDSSFNVIRTNGINNLVIDLRFNGGGSQSASIHLLQYLVNNPFTYYSTAQFPGKQAKIEGEEVVYPFENRFKGDCYFIIDGFGNSTTGHFMSIIKYFKIGTIVGEELGSNQFCSAGMTTRRLANTKLVYYIANNTHESLAVTLPDETGILPDFYVTQSLDDYLNNIDAVKAFTLQLIEQTK